MYINVVIRMTGTSQSHSDSEDIRRQTKKNEKKRRDEQNSRLERQNREISLQLKAAKHEIDQLRQSNSQFQVDTKRLKSKNQTLTAEVGQLKSDQNQATITIRQLQVDKSKLLTNLTEAQGVVVKQRQAVATVTTEKENLLGKDN